MAISFANSFCFNDFIDLPLIVTSPNDGLFNPANMLNKVDFPLPLGPNIVVIFPFSISTFKLLIKVFSLS